MSATDERRRRGEPAIDPPPAAMCRDCGYAWHSAAVVHGLRILGSCPRCRGGLRFTAPPGRRDQKGRSRTDVPPHLALGLPRPKRLGRWQHRASE